MSGLQKKGKDIEKRLTKKQVFTGENIIFNNSEEEDIVEEYDEFDDEDYSITEERKIEKSINPETERISKRKVGFQIIKVKENSYYKYELINFSNKENLYNDLKKIVKFFPWFEKLTKQKFFALASDKRTGGLLEINKNYSFDYSILLPNGEIVPISSLKREKGKYENPYFSNYRKFRKIIYENIDYINKLKREDVEKDENDEGLDVFVGAFLVAVESKKPYYDESYVEKTFEKIIRSDDALINSELVKGVLKEYMGFFWGEGKWKRFMFLKKKSI